MSRSRAVTRHQRARAIGRARRNAAGRTFSLDDKSIKKMAQFRGVCSCALCKHWKHVRGNTKQRWEGVRQMMRAEQVNARRIAEESEF